MTYICKEKGCEKKAEFRYDFGDRMKQLGMKVQGKKAKVLSKLTFNVCSSHRKKVEAGLKQKGMSFQPTKL